MEYFEDQNNQIISILTPTMQDILLNLKGDFISSTTEHRSNTCNLYCSIDNIPKSTLKSLKEHFDREKTGILSKPIFSIIDTIECTSLLKKSDSDLFGTRMKECVMTVLNYIAEGVNLDSCIIIEQELKSFIITPEDLNHLKESTNLLPLKPTAQK